MYLPPPKRWAENKFEHLRDKPCPHPSECTTNGEARQAQRGQGWSLPGRTGVHQSCKECIIGVALLQILGCQLFATIQYLINFLCLSALCATLHSNSHGVHNEEPSSTDAYVDPKVVHHGDHLAPTCVFVGEQNVVGRPVTWYGRHPPFLRTVHPEGPRTQQGRRGCSI